MVLYLIPCQSFLRISFPTEAGLFALENKNLSFDFNNESLSSLFYDTMAHRDVFHMNDFSYMGDEMAARGSCM